MLKQLLAQRRFQALTAVGIFVFVVKVFVLQPQPPKKIFLPYNSELFAKIDGSSFEGFDNNTGTPDGKNIVPNYVHFIFYENSYITYVTAVCVLAAYKNQQPEKLFFHTNVNNSLGLTG
jgi:hypothetical protein